MRRLMLFLLVTIAAVPLAAQLHEATPLDVLMERVHMMAMPAYTQAQPAVLPIPEAATKVFNLDAHRFSYGVNPSPFVVNQGDMVTLNVKATDTTHGWFLETYDPQGAVIALGTTHTVQFVANTPGTFTYFCTFFCGSGHSGMSGTFTVNAVQSTAPTIDSISPTSGTTAGGTTLTIKGTNFAAGATVKLGVSDMLNVNVVDATTITAVTPLGPASEEVAIPMDVTVTNADGQSATKSAAFSYFVPAPAITSLSPDIATLTGGFVITVKGVGFTGAVVTTVTFGGVPATNVTIVDAVTLTAVAPAHAAGKVDVTVTVGTASATKASAFTYAKPAGHRRASRP